MMIVGHFALGNLESSYKIAFEALGCHVTAFDIKDAVDGHTRLGRGGQFFNTFVPVEPWIRKANREMILRATHTATNLLVVVGQQPVRAGALAQIQASTHARAILIWPDPLLNLDAETIACLPLYDLVATYSSATLDPFRRLGASHVEWVPLAADPSLHSPVICTPSEQSEFEADISFIGGWRPEREALLKRLGVFNLKIWGTGWRRHATDPAVKKAFQGRALRGAEFAKAVTRSKVNLNIIDQTNYSAPNMRFFEISMAGGLQVSSYCPEMGDEFRHGEHIFYYRNAAELPGLVKMLLPDEPMRQRVAAAAHDKVLAGHTYKHRAECILSMEDR
jgi:spore maturation protein CgeB